MDLSCRLHSHSPTYLQLPDTYRDIALAFVPVIHASYSLAGFWITQPRTTHAGPARATAPLPAGAVPPPVGPIA
eukprot:297343-Pleurochrysis_carterae.AAC.1